VLYYARYHVGILRYTALDITLGYCVNYVRYDVGILWCTTLDITLGYCDILR